MAPANILRLFSVFTVILYFAISYGLQKDNLRLLEKRQAPGFNNPQKSWWAKEITVDLHVAGRLSERQMKYTLESGFKSILSLFFYGDSQQGNFGGEKLPTTKQAMDIADSIGIHFAFILNPEDTWYSVKAVEKLTQVLSSVPHPVLLFSDQSYTISFVTLMHLANQTRYNKNFEPKINSEQFYQIAASMGLDFTEDFLKNTVSEITGEPVVEYPVMPYVIPANWTGYWLGHPVYKNWHTAGQITPAHIKILESLGFKAVINLRAGVQFENKPSQEEVALLNIKAETGTYGNDQHQPRQSIKRLEETRIDPNKPNTYISKTSLVNYEVMNPEEFGDEIGYNENLEKEAFQKSSISYYHFAWTSSAMKDERAIDFFERNMKKMVEIGKSGPVLVHCRTAKRAAYVAVSAAALQHGMSFDWALQRSRELGFAVSEEKKPFIYRAIKSMFTPHDELIQRLKSTYVNKWSSL